MERNTKAIRITLQLGSCKDASNDDINSWGPEVGRFDACGPELKAIISDGAVAESLDGGLSEALEMLAKQHREAVVLAEAGVLK